MSAESKIGMGVVDPNRVMHYVDPYIDLSALAREVAKDREAVMASRQQSYGQSTQEASFGSRVMMHITRPVREDQEA